MALALYDRVKETTTTVGTGSVTLLGATTGFQSFAVVGNANTTYYCIADQGGANWEVGIGTYTASGTTLARTTVLSSSNADALVTFTAGIKDVFVTYPSSKGVWKDASGNAIGLGTPASGVVTNLTGTASININGTVGATTATTGAFTTLAYTGTLTGGTGVVAIGTNQIYKDASGNVGIGIVPNTSLTPKLEIASAFSAPTAGSPYNGLLVESTDAQAGDKGGVISFGGLYDASSGVTRFAAIAGLKENSTSGQYGGYMAFYTRANGSSPAEAMRINSSGNVLVTSPAGLGYGTGSGGTVTQATNKSTGVTLNKPTGQITMNAAALLPATQVGFTLTNSLLTINDVVVVNIDGFSGTSDAYNIMAAPITGGTYIFVKNISAGSLSEAIRIHFAIIKGASS